MRFERTRQKCKAIRDRVYPKDQWPGVRYQEAVIASGGPERTLLELGCGREARVLRRLAPHFAFSWGVDLEKVADGSDEERWKLIQGDAHRIPLGDESVDVVASANAVEHFADPVAAFRESARVLRPGGRVVLITVNQWFPPIVLGRILPHSWRQRVNGVATGTADEDTFPVFYRANSARSLTRAAEAAGLTPVQVRYVSSHPQYLMFSVLAYRLGIALERFVARHAVLHGWQHFLLGVFERPAARRASNNNRNGISSG